MLRDVPDRLSDRALTLRILIALATAGAALSAAASTGCSGVSCDAPHCPKDPAPLNPMIATCNNAHSNKCSGSYDDWIRCINDRTKCDSVSRTSDPISHADAFTACDPKYQTYKACASAL